MGGMIPESGGGSQTFHARRRYDNPLSGTDAVSQHQTFDPHYTATVQPFTARGGRL